ncbi:MAG: sulfotransferase, partial [bacterium]
MLKTHLQFWITSRRVDAWSEKVNVFFVLAIGRSGTSFLAHLLDQAPGAHVVHEPIGEDFMAYQEAFHDPDAARSYVHRFRKKEIYLRARAVQMEHMEAYGEVNSALRRHARALAAAFPDAVLFHLVRDGRDVVRSMSARRTMTPEDKNTNAIRPRPGDPWAGKWEQMDRFARLCWYWQVE